jgi:xylulokinase
LPAVQSPLARAGSVGQMGAQDTGLLSGTPVITGTSDTAAEVVGAGGLRPGQAIVKLASVGRIMLVLDHPLDHPHSLNYPHVFDGLWYPGTVTKHSASAYSWARTIFWSGPDGLATFREMDQAAASVEPGCQGLLFFPHLSGEYAPQWDPELRATFAGLTVQHQRRHLTRAVLEGVAFQIRAALEQIVAAGGHFDEIRLIGGGAASPLWGQIMADILSCPLVVPDESSAAYGAGLLAGIAAGLLPQKPQELATIIQVARRLTPNPEVLPTYQKLYNIYNETGRELTQVSHRLEAFSRYTQLPNFQERSAQIRNFKE